MCRQLLMMKFCLEQNKTFLVFLLLNFFCVQFAPCRSMELGSVPNDAEKLLQYLTMTLKARDGTASGAEIIMEQGEIQTKWSDKCAPKSCTPHTFDMYTDEVIFEFSYTNATLFSFSTPVVNAHHGRAHPSVVDFSFDDDVRAGEFSIWHYCTPPRPKSHDAREDQTMISLVFYITSTTTFRLTWNKICGGGTNLMHPFLNYGYFSEHHSRHVLNPVRYSTKTRPMEKPFRGRCETENIIFGPRILATRFFLRLNDSAYSQQFGPASISIDFVRDKSRKIVKKLISSKPYVINETNITSAASMEHSKPIVELRGSVNGGMLRADMDTLIDILYTCQGSGIWLIHLEIPLPPFDSMRTNWVKDCGGGIEQGVHVVSKAEIRRPDVVNEGITKPMYLRGVTKQKNNFRGGGNRIFFLIIDGRCVEGGIMIGDIVAHSEDDRVGVARINDMTESWPNGFRNIPPDGEVVTSQVRRIIRIKVDCFKRGKLHVVVRVSIRDRQPVEWWFWNECIVQRGHRHSKSERVTKFTGASMALFFVAVGLIIRRFSPRVRKNHVIHSRYRGAASRLRIVYSDSARRFA